MLWLEEAEKMQNIQIIFNQVCEGVDLENDAATCKVFNSKKEIVLTADVIFGTDGAGSVVRKSMFDSHKFLFSFSQQWLSHGYKELEIPAAENNGYRTYKNVLHIWPRSEDMLIELPNLDGSLTVMLFLPYENGAYCSANLTTPYMVHESCNMSLIHL